MGMFAAFTFEQQWIFHIIFILFIEMGNRAANCMCCERSKSSRRRRMMVTKAMAKIEYRVQRRRISMFVAGVRAVKQSMRNDM